MQIHDRFNGPHLSSSQSAGQPAPAESRRRAQDAPATLRTSLEGSVLRQLQGMPELREELVARARTLLEQGKYLTPDAARATAGALLDAG